MKKKILSLFLISAMSVSLVGCSNFSLPFFKSEPKNAQEAYEKYQENMNADEIVGYNMAGSYAMNMDVSYTTDGVTTSTSIPIDINFDVDLYGDRLHGAMDVSMTYSGTTSSTSAEIYQDIENTYTNSGSGWIRTDTESGEDSSAFNNILNINMPETATFESTDDEYIVTTTVGEVFDEDTIESLFSMSESAVSDIDMDYTDMLEQMKDVIITYEFDKDCYLTKVSIENMSYSSTILDVAGIDMSLSLTIEFSKYGEITEENVAAPEDVISSAMEEGDDLIEDEVDDASESEIVDDNAVIDGEDAETGEDVDEYSETEEEAEEGITSSQKAKLLSQMSYNGTWYEFPMSYSVLLSDGWASAGDESYSSYLIMTNEKYPDIELYVYSVYTGEVITEDYVIENGVCGLSIQLYGEITSYPDIKIGNTEQYITIGTTRDEVIAILGEPDYTTTVSDYEYISYSEYFVSNSYLISYSLSVKVNDAGVFCIDMDYDDTEL